MLAAVDVAGMQPHQRALAPACLPTNTALWGQGSCAKQKNPGREGDKLGKREGGLQSDATPLPSVMLLGDPISTSSPRCQVVPEPILPWYQGEVEMPARLQPSSRPPLAPQFPCPTQRPPWWQPLSTRNAGSS